MQKFASWLFLLALLLPCIGTVYADVPVSHIKMQVGDVRVMDLDYIYRVALGDKSLLSYKPLDKGEMLVIAEKPGYTSMHVWRKGNRQHMYQVTITESNLAKKLTAARRLGKAVSGLTLRELDGLIVLEGKVDKADKQTRIKEILNAFPGSIDMTEIRDFEFEKMVRLDVSIIEVSKKSVDQLGVKWDSRIQGPTVGMSGAMKTNPFFSGYSGSPVPVGDGSFYGFIGLQSQVTSRIDLMAQTGEAKVLAKPKLSARSGATAEFHSGGEFPFQVIDENNRPSVEFRPYGIILEIVPVVDHEDNIYTQIRAEVSNIDHANKVGDVPGLLTRKSKTAINLRDNETIAISGLSSGSVSQAVSKVPFLGDIPWLGWLFKTNATQTEETELVIFVTPHLIKPGDQWDKPLVDAGLAMQAEYEQLINNELME